MGKKLYLSGSDKKIAGVCGGIGEFLNIDPTIIRLVWIVLTIFSWFFPGVIAYLIAWAVIPPRQQTM